MQNQNCIKANALNDTQAFDTLYCSNGSKQQKCRSHVNKSSYQRYEWHKIFTKVWSFWVGPDFFHLRLGLAGGDEQTSWTALHFRLNTSCCLHGLNTTRGTISVTSEEEGAELFFTVGSL